MSVRCKKANLCSTAGVKVILTDLNKDKPTDLVLSGRAFMSMSLKNMSQELKKAGTVDVEYKRIPCEYARHNLSVRVEENSKSPNYIAIKFLYQGGQTDIVGVDVAQVGSSDWRYMTRRNGPVWETDRAPAGPLQLRLVVTGGYDGKTLLANNVLPADWKLGALYGTGVRITDIAQEGCSPCDDKEWT
ncbi:Expansin [Asimina triloba]